MTVGSAWFPVALALASCATGGRLAHRHALPPPARESRAGAPERSAGPAPASDAAVARAVSAAESLVGRRTVVLDGVDYGPGCAALARAAFDRAGRPLPPDVREARELHTLAVQRGALRSTRRPSAGDLVFLADRPGGPAVHVGIVAKLEPDGTALILHRVARGVQRLRVNLAFPERRVDPATGRHINDTLVVGAKPQPAGSLVVGVSDLLRRG